MIWKNSTVRTAILIISFILAVCLFFLNSWLTIPIGIIYAIIIPGFLLFAAIRREIEASWTTVILSVALGVTTFMFLALLVNVVGSVTGNQHPLTIGSLIPANFLLVAFLSCFYRRWTIKMTRSFTPLSVFERSLIVASFITLVCFIVGAASLNNGFVGWLSVFCFLSIPIFIIVLFVKHKTVRGNVAITVLWVLSLGLLLSGWLRSWYVSGPDVSLEYRLAEIVSTNNIWSIETIKHAYNSCLSVSLFAPAVGIITKSSLALTFKFIIPLLYSLVVPIVYLITVQFLKKRSAIIASAFFMAQPVFVVWWWIPIRQQVAFLLFGALLLLIVQYKERSRRMLALLLILSLGLVVAHYTTALMAIAYFAVVWVISSILYRSKRHTSLKSPVPLVIIVLLMVSYFIWYAQLTYGFSGVTQFATKSLSGITSLLDGVGTGDKKDVLSQINIFSTQKQPDHPLEDYEQKRSEAIRSAYSEKNMYSEQETGEYQTEEVVPKKQNDTWLEAIRQLFISLSKVVVILGVLVILWLSIKNNELRRYAILSASALGMLAVTAILPSFSVSYDLVRTYQQLLFVMAGIFSIIFLVRRKYRNISSYILLGFTVIFFVLTSHTLSFFYHSSTTPVNLSNQGTEHLYRYTVRTDVLLGDWLMTHTTKEDTISGDSLARDRLRLTLDPNKSQSMLNTVMPTALPRSAYVIKNQYANAENAYDTFESNLIIYNYPTPFLNSMKNAVYSNNGSVLYR